MVGKCCSAIKYVNSRRCFCEISFVRFPKNPLELVMSIGSLDKCVFDALFSPSLARSLYYLPAIMPIICKLQLFLVFY